MTAAATVQLQSLLSSVLTTGNSTAIAESLAQAKDVALNMIDSLTAPTSSQLVSADAASQCLELVSILVAAPNAAGVDSTTSADVGIGAQDLVDVTLSISQAVRTRQIYLLDLLSKYLC